MADTTETTTIIVRLSLDTLAQLNAFATRHNKSRDDIVERLLALTLPMIEKESNAELNQRVNELSGLDDVQLRIRTIAEMETKDLRRASKLLQSNKERILTSKERAQLEVIQDKGMDVALTKLPPCGCWIGGKYCRSRDA